METTIPQNKRTSKLGLTLGAAVLAAGLVAYKSVDFGPDYDEFRESGFCNVSYSDKDLSDDFERSGFTQTSANERHFLKRVASLNRVDDLDELDERSRILIPCKYR